MADYIAELVGFLVVVAVIWWKVVPPVRNLMRRQQELVASQIEAAKAAEERLASANEKYRTALADARTEAAKIRDAAREDAQRILEEMRAQAEREVERIRQRGEEDLVAQRQQVIRELRRRIGELSVDMAGELVTEHLATPANRSATVDRLLAELEAMSASTTEGAGHAGRE
jgi:F-type H+-transporting ATPase subunit b